MRPPVEPQVVMTSKFGVRTLNGKKQFHPGIDLRAIVDAPIYAPEQMKIIRHGKGNVYGENFVVAEGTLLYKFMHCKLVNGLKAGDIVAEGTVIAKSDSSGTSASHLHFETWIKDTKEKAGKAIDPEEYFFNRLLGKEFYPYMEGDKQRWYLQG
jgi:murein DD-endopeptidase MepM/ murein hydrolase activator NlpD